MALQASVLSASGCSSSTGLPAASSGMRDLRALFRRHQHVRAVERCIGQCLLDRGEDLLARRFARQSPGRGRVGIHDGGDVVTGESLQRLGVFAGQIARAHETDSTHHSFVPAKGPPCERERNGCARVWGSRRLR